MLDEKVVQIINSSKKIVYVTVLDEPKPGVTGVNPGRSACYHVYAGKTRMTLSCYSKEREMEDLCTAHVFKKGCTLRVID